MPLISPPSARRRKQHSFMAIGARLKTAFPPPFRTLAESFFWAMAMAACSGLSLYLRHWYRAPQAFELIVIFFAGGFLAWPLARFAIRLAAPAPFGTRRIAADILGTITATVGVTALVFALHFRAEMSRWHDHSFSIHWFAAFAFTIIGAAVQFLVLGLDLFLPALTIALPAYLIWVLLRGQR
jgi:hypothetical protein